MKKIRSQQDKLKDNLEKNIKDPDDSLKPVNESNEEQPEIYKISKRGLSINRKNFVKSAASVAGLAALGNLLKSCEESELDITKSGENCTCHAVCTCNSEVHEGEKFNKGDKYESKYDTNKYCTCDTVCTCHSVCSCDSVCTCNTEGGGGGGGGSYYYTYWYPC
jgi:hypothetical protein